MRFHYLTVDSEQTSNWVEEIVCAIVRAVSSTGAEKLFVSLNLHSDSGSRKQTN